MEIFIDGFEQFKDSPKVIDHLVRAGYMPLNNGQVTVTNGRRATTQGVQTVNSAVRRTWPWTDRFFSAGMALMMQNRGNLLVLELGAEKVVCWIDVEQGVPMLNTQPGGALPWTKTWYYFEVVVDRSTFTASLWINGRIEVENLAIPTSVDALSEVTVAFGSAHPGVPMGNIPITGGTVVYDDLYVRDGDRLGPLTVTTRFPTSSNPAQWQRSPDAASNHEAVSQLPPKELDINVGSGDIGAIDLYQSSAQLPSGNEIVVTGMCVLARKSPALAAQLGLSIQGNGTVSRSALMDLEGVWKTRYVTFPRQVTDTKPGIEGASFGITVV